MASSKSPPETTLALIAALEKHGQAKLGNLELRLNQQSSGRFVIGFIEASDNGAWLTGVCAEARLSLLCVVAQSPEDFGQPKLKSFFKALASHPLCINANAISLCGRGPGGTAALSHSKAFQDPVVVAFDLTPTTSAADMKSVAKGLATAYVFYDPFHDPLTKQHKGMEGSHIHWLKCFALGESCLNSLWRMKYIPVLLAAALRNELVPALHYKMIRTRKNYRFYRLGMEAALTARKQDTRLVQFKERFRQHQQAEDPEVQFEALRSYAQQGRPNHPNAWARAGHTDDSHASWPSAGGNIWMLEHNNGAMRYLSDRWNGQTMGYEERAGVTLAQTPDLALGMVGFGHGMQVERPLSRRFDAHVTDERLDGTAPIFSPVAEATLLCEQRHRTHECLSSLLAITQSQAGITAPEALRGAPAYDALLAQVQASCTVLEDWGKSLFIDRVRLALLAGAPQTPNTEAAVHYGDVATALSHDLTAITGQTSSPLFVVIQSAGTRTSGLGEVIIAEGRFDIDNPLLNGLVPTPAYPWPLMSGTPSTHSPQAALLMDEISMIAVSERQQGRPWHCPSLQFATTSGLVVTAQFSSMAGLKLEDGPHGFHFLGATDTPNITRVEVISDAEVQLHLDAEISGADIFLAYAWGHEVNHQDTDRSANHGALRDNWEHPSVAVPDQMLRRFALSGVTLISPGPQKPVLK
jgi:hypothetical protein